MPNSYVITIKNNSDAAQDYSIFNAKPVINGKVQKDIYSNVFCNFSTAKNDTAEVTLSTQYKAVVGSHRQDGEAVQVKVGQTRDVNLGLANDDGTVTNGTTLEFTRAAENGAPTFSEDELASAGFANAFAIKCPANSGWAKSDAIANNWVIGLGLSSSEGMGPTATFIPEPGPTYQIQPSNTFYISPNMFIKGRLMDVAKIGDAIAIDFTKFPTGKVTIVHGKQGGLTIQKSGAF
ncbi:hypothetical protein SUNI508_07939 [Seiridium unicorne]|uniref:Uncharacterized protein n=1 Tax=Seiridium unicorne TaxID=138068 RepID=A0ABR2UVN5_9PEZI